MATLLDLDLTSSTDWTAAGFSSVGSGITYSADGMNGNGTGNIVLDPFAGRTAITDQFSMTVEIKRSDLAMGYDLNTSLFYDQVGAGLASNGYPFFVSKKASNNNQVSLLHIASTGAMQFTARGNTGGGVSTSQHSFNAEYMAGEEDAFVKILVSGNGDTVKYYLDGKLVRTTTIAAGLVISDMFERITIGARDGGSSKWVGNVRRFTLTDTATPDYTYTRKVALFGDSFTQRGTNRANASSDTVEEIDNVQNSLDDTSINDSVNTAFQGIQGHGAWAFALQRVAIQNGHFFRIYNAGRSGHGFSSAASQFPQAYIDAVIAYDPEIIITAASVNDPSDAGLLADTKSILDELADGCPSLTHILFFNNWPGWKGDSGLNEATNDFVYAASQGLSGYQAGTSKIPVTLVDTYTALGGSSYNADFNLGSHNLADDWDAINTVTDVSDNDLHPGIYGSMRMAENIWPTLLSALQGGGNGYLPSLGSGGNLRRKRNARYRYLAGQ